MVEDADELDTVAFEGVVVPELRTAATHGEVDDSVSPWVLENPTILTDVDEGWAVVTYHDDQTLVYIRKDGVVITYIEASRTTGRLDTSQPTE